MIIFHGIEASLSKPSTSLKSFLNKTKCNACTQCIVKTLNLTLTLTLCCLNPKNLNPNVTDPNPYPNSNPNPDNCGYESN